MSQLQIAILRLMNELAEKKSHEAKWVTVGKGAEGEHGRKFQIDTDTGKILKGGGAAMHGKTFNEAFRTEKNALASDIAQAAVKKHGKGTVGEYLRGGAHEMANQVKAFQELTGVDPKQAIKAQYQQGSTVGKTNTVKTAKGTKVETKFKVIDASELIASHDIHGNHNPSFPPELQPRDRSKGTSQQWVQKTAKGLDTNSLGESTRADTGAPIVGDDNVVESGNGRSMAMLHAYNTGNAENYREWLTNEAADLGIDPETVKGMKQPILVRERVTDLDRRQFTKEANEDDKLSMSATEKALSDADKLDVAMVSKISGDGNLRHSDNKEFIRAFLGSLSDSDAAQYYTKSGKLTRSIFDRVQSAVFAKAYNDDRLLEMMADDDKSEIKNIIGALNMAAPAFIQAKNLSEGDHKKVSETLADGIELSLDEQTVNTLVEATNAILASKNAGLSLEDYLAQTSVFGEKGQVSEDAAAMAIFIKENNRSAAKMGEAFKTMADFISKDIESRQTESMLGEPEPLDLKTIIRAAGIKLKEPENKPNSVGLLEDGFQPFKTRGESQTTHSQSRNLAARLVLQSLNLQRTAHALKWITTGGGTNNETGKGTGRHIQLDTTTGVITKGYGAGKTLKEAFNPEPKTERQKIGRKFAEAGAKKFGGSEREYRNLGVTKGQADSFANQYLKTGDVPEGHLRDAASEPELQSQPQQSAAAVENTQPPLTENWQDKLNQLVALKKGDVAQSAKNQPSGSGEADLTINDFKAMHTAKKVKDMPNTGGSRGNYFDVTNTKNGKVVRKFVVSPQTPDNAISQVFSDFKKYGGLEEHLKTEPNPALSGLKALAEEYGENPVVKESTVPQTAREMQQASERAAKEANQPQPHQAPAAQTQAGGGEKELQARPKFQKERDFLVDKIKDIANPKDFKSEDFMRAGMGAKSHMSYVNDLQALSAGIVAGQKLSDNEYRALYKTTKEKAEKIANFHKQPKQPQPPLPPEDENGIIDITNLAPESIPDSKEATNESVASEISPHALNALERFVKNGTIPQGSKRESLIEHGYLNSQGELTKKGIEHTKPVSEQIAKQAKAEGIKTKAADTKQANAEKTLSEIELPHGYLAQLKDGKIVVSGVFTDKMHDDLKEMGFNWDGTRGNNTKTWIAPLTSAKRLYAEYAKDDSNFGSDPVVKLDFNSLQYQAKSGQSTYRTKEQLQKILSSDAGEGIKQQAQELFNTIEKNDVAKKDRRIAEEQQQNERKKYESSLKALSGDTYAIRNELQSKFGAKWNGASWKVPPEKYEEAQAFVNSNAKPKKEQPKKMYTWNTSPEEALAAGVDWFDLPS